MAFANSFLWSLCSSHPQPARGCMFFWIQMACLCLKIVHMAAGHNDQTLTWSAGDVVIWCYMCLLWIVVWPMIGTYEEETGRSISVWWCVAAEAKIIQVLLPRYPGSFRWHFQPQRMSMRTLRRTVGPQIASPHHAFGQTSFIWTREWTWIYLPIWDKHI